MTLTILNSFILFMSLLFVGFHLLTFKGQKAHLYFAIFCLSSAIMTLKYLSADYIAPYHYIIGMGASAICNGYWLLSRVFFRRRNPIEKQHIIVAVAIALLVVMNQGFHLMKGLGYIDPDYDGFLIYIVVELTILLSSCILVLTVWEGCRGFAQDTNEGKAQRIFFILTFGVALVGNKIARGLLPEGAQDIDIILAIILLFVMTNTFILMIWKYTNRFDFITAHPLLMKQAANDSAAKTASNIESATENPGSLAHQIKSLLIEQSLFLHENLKVADIARELNISEYLISQTIRDDLAARNFNQYVNQLRIDHSCRLLSDPEKRKMSILSISLESGFASIGPFTRAFKAQTGLTPSAYRKSLAEPPSNRKEA
ncbi:AraC family transcriptional regulator [Temperatibacter marinus]|uniref:AraC family transcriptional regulator n=1 Tax=Temperatibacter marinus TaxID=1456591 RepID=A0AA52H9L3_9PROT|nr:AraC family transcriptional regulator [Temperatibacter marinus]WND01805.1 AraC family transcriptional regulator [Temperatibacter marinus]